VETISDALMALDALSVSVKMQMPTPTKNKHCLVSPACHRQRQAGRSSELPCLLMMPPAADAGKLLVLQAFFKEAFARHQPGGEQDWVRLTQSQFEPVPITDTFWVVPSWHEPPAQAQWVLRLDPGLAFGTGTHPTTRMCLRWIAGCTFEGAGALVVWPRTYRRTLGFGGYFEPTG
jgi:ribosomal protein L11 methyltransferase